MNEKQKLLAAKLLADAGEEYSNHGCNDFYFPQDWNQDECAAFSSECWVWAGEPTATHTPPDWMVMEYLAALLTDEAVSAGAVDPDEGTGQSGPRA